MMIGGGMGGPAPFHHANNHHQPPQQLDSFKIYQQKQQQLATGGLGCVPNQALNYSQQPQQQQQLTHQQPWSGLQQQQQLQNNTQIQKQQQSNQQFQMMPQSQLQQQQQLMMQQHNQMNSLQQQQHPYQQQQQQVQQQPQPQNNFNEDPSDQGDIIGVIKIKDGIFICDEFGAQDLEFVVANKVARVVNTAGTQLPNHWEPIGVLYLTLNWQDDEKQTLFDSQEKIPDEIYKFIEEAIDNQESVLVQSVKAQNRACFVIAAVIMRRYRWSLLKTLEFLNSRRPDLEMRPSFLSQLSQYENRLQQRGLGYKTQRWTELSDNNIHIENEELILRNTYLNSQMAPLVDLSGINIEEDKLFKLKWVDQTYNRSLSEEGPDEEDLINKFNPPPIMNHRENRNCKSIVKGSRLNLAQKAAAAAQSNSNVAPKSKFLAKTSFMQTTTSNTMTQQQSIQQPLHQQINFHPQQNQEENMVMINHPQQNQQQKFPLQDHTSMMNYSNQLEPKKRELTQKIPQKTTVPNDDKSMNANISSMSHQLENMMNENQQNANPLQAAIGIQSKIQNLQSQQPFSQQQNLLSQQNRIRGISPSVQQKQTNQDLNSAQKRTSQGFSQPQFSNIQNYGNSSDIKKNITTTSTYQRPGSAPKRPQTPTQHPSSSTINSTGTISTQQSSTQNSFIKPQQHPMGNPQNLTMKQAIDMNNQGARNGDHNNMIMTHQQPGVQGKNMLNSFRNGPIKIMTNNNTSFANKTESGPAKISTVSRPTPNKTGQIRPASAPAKRPSSPNQGANSNTTTMNRTKYTPQTSSAVTRSAVFKQGQNILNNTNSNTSASANNSAGVKPGLNPTLRGYSPSKMRWKLNNAQPGAAQSSTNQYSNPNAYTRSTKHIPSYKQ